jgi:hypothetical protein
MKSITIDLPDAELEEIEEYARRHSRAAVDVVREAIEDYHRRRIAVKRPVSVLDIPARSVGAILKPLSPDDDLLEEMLSDDP